MFFFGGPSWSWLYGCWIYNYLCNQCLSLLKLWIWIPLRGGVLDITICDKVCQWLWTGQWLSPVSSTNKTDCHDITEILLKVVLNTKTLTLTHHIFYLYYIVFFISQYFFYLHHIVIYPRILFYLYYIVFFNLPYFFIYIILLFFFYLTIFFIYIILLVFF